MSRLASLAGEGMRHVFVRDMVLQAAIGVYAHEHGQTQRVRVNVDLAVQETGVGLDELDQVVSYEDVVKRVRAIVGAGHTKLVETLAERIAAACLEDGRVQRAVVRVEKLDVFADTGSVGVEIERCKSSTTPAPGRVDS
jgi:dihydroneopterin aldolase